MFLLFLPLCLEAWSLALTLFGMQHLSTVLSSLDLRGAVSSPVPFSPGLGSVLLSPVSGWSHLFLDALHHLKILYIENVLPTYNPLSIPAQRHSTLHSIVHFPCGCQGVVLAATIQHRERGTACYQFRKDQNSRLQVLKEYNHFHTITQSKYHKANPGVDIIQSPLLKACSFQSSEKNSVSCQNTY